MNTRTRSRRPLGGISDPSNAPAHPTPVQQRPRTILKTPRRATPGTTTSATAGPPPIATPFHSDGPTLRGLRVAFQETPIHLRELEVGWRERRMERLSPRSRTVKLPEVGEEADGVGPESVRAVCRECREHTISRVFPSIPPRDAGRAELGNRQAKTHITSKERMPVNSETVPKATSHTPAPTLHTNSRPADTLATTSQPINSGCLPPCTTPTPITRHSGTTIQVLHPGDGPWAIIIRDPQRTISVARDGRSMRVARESSHLPPEPRRSRLFLRRPPTSAVQTMRLDTARQWAAQEHAEWNAVAELVERYKRATPHAKVYTALGQLLITCSSPPDIILSFFRPAISPAASASPSASEPYARNEVAAPGKTRVRITLSRAAGQLVVDTATISGTSASRETYRTRRAVSVMGPVPSGGHGGKRVESRSSSGAAMRGLGVLGMYEPRGEADRITLEGLEGQDGGKGWSEVEYEAARRLWAVRDEWQRYG